MWTSSLESTTLTTNLHFTIALSILLAPWSVAFAQSSPGCPMLEMAISRSKIRSHLDAWVNSTPTLSSSTLLKTMATSMALSRTLHGGGKSLSLDRTTPTLLLTTKLTLQLGSTTGSLNSNALKELNSASHTLNSLVLTTTLSRKL